MRFFLSLLVALGIFNSSALALTASYEQIIYQNDEVVANFKIVQHNASVRAESNLGGATTVIIQNSEGNFTYFPEQNISYKVSKSSAPNISDDIEDYMGFLTRNQAVEVGTETIGAYPCTIYEFTDPISGHQSKAWVWTEKEFPVKVEIYSPEGTLRVAFEEINFDIEPDEAFFQVPSDAELMDMENMSTSQSAPTE